MRSRPPAAGATRIQSPGAMPHDRSRPGPPLRFMLCAMNFSTKIAIIVRDDLAPWQKLNVACFLSGGLVGSYPELAGERYEDGSGRRYGRLIRQPVLIFAADGTGLRRALERATERGIEVALYTSEL